jgi:hypothetical protein
MYQRFGAGLTTADVGRAIAPVLRDGKLVAVQSKLGRSKYEPHLKPSDAWAPVPLGSVSMGILVCLDFLARTEGRIAQLVVPRLDECAVLAVPSLTPFGTPEHFASSAEEMLYGYDRLVVYANSAAYGGTQLFTHKSEKAPAVVLAQGRPPALAKGVEGVVAAEVRGRGTRRGDVRAHPSSSGVDAGKIGEPPRRRDCAAPSPPLLRSCPRRPGRNHKALWQYGQRDPLCRGSRARRSHRSTEARYRVGSAALRSRGEELASWLGATDVCGRRRRYAG